VSFFITLPVRDDFALSAASERFSPTPLFVLA